MAEDCDLGRVVGRDELWITEMEVSATTERGFQGFGSLKISSHSGTDVCLARAAVLMGGDMVGGISSDD